MLKINDKNLLNTIKAAKAGNMEAFGDLYSYSYSRVYQTALVILRNKEDAEDVCQEVFIRALESLPTLRIPEQYNFWLHRITVNQCLNFKRKKMPDTDNFYDAEFMPDSSIDVNPFIKNLSNERHRVLLKSLLSMSEVHRTTIFLKYYDHCKIEDIAAIFDCSPGTVKSRLNTARNLLKKSLQSQGINSGFLVALPIGPTLNSWAQASLPSVQTTTQTFHHVTAAKQTAESVTLNPIEAAKASSHFLPTNFGVFTATAAALIVIGGTALGITTFKTPPTAEAPVYPSVTTVSFVSPSIDAVSYSQEYLSELPLTLSIEHPESIASLQLSNEKGERINLPFDASGAVAFTLSENGHYQILIQSKNGETIAKDFDVQTIDHDAPTLIEYTSQENFLTITLSDEGAGIDFDSIYATTDSGLHLLPGTTDHGQGQITFEMPNENATVYYQDKAGNFDSLSIKANREKVGM